MNDLELTLTAQRDSIRAQTPGGAEVAGSLVLDSLHRDLVGIFVDWLEQDRIKRRRELEVFGSLLYRVLFSGEVDRFFNKTLAGVPRGERLRVQLSFQSDAADLADLPWEFLHSPNTETRAGFFLATSVAMVLSRYMPLDVDRAGLAPEESPLRILIVVSKPADLGSVVAPPVIKEIEKLAESEEIEIAGIVDTPTIDNFLDALESTKPHVLHFMGHGQYNRTERKGEIALLAPDEKRAYWCEDRNFAEYFVQMRSTPRLIVLHSCEGGVIEYGAGFAGLAPQLIRAKVQAVVAMQYPITNQAAIAFSRAFYRELAKGEPVDHAVQAGRWRITTTLPDAYDSRVFGTPVLYMHSRDGLIRPAA